MDTEETYQRITQYLNGEMSSDEMDRFEEDLRKDAELKKAFQAEVLIEEAVGEFRQGKEMPLRDNKNLKSNNRRNLLLTITSTAAIVFLSLWLINRNEGNPIKQNPYMAIYTGVHKTPFPGPDSYLGAKDPADKLFVENYNKGDYFNANIELARLYQTNPEDDTTQLYLAITYLELSKPGMTIQLLSCYSSPSILYTQRAQWCVALAYLQMGQVDPASNQGKVILRDSSHNYHRKAEELTRKLEKLRNP